MRLTRMCVDLVFATLEARVGAAQALTSEAFALAWEQNIGLDDVDRELLLGRLAAAGTYLATLLCALDHELARLDGDKAVAAAAHVASRYRPRVEAGDGRKAYLCSLVSTATDRVARARRLVVRFGSKSGSHVVEGLSRTGAHLEIADHLLADKDRRRRGRPASPGFELVIEEHRELVRRRRRPGGGDEMTSV